ncbi:OB-fold domain-containing protein [Nocardioides sp. Root190]|uniref:OB-fold domain-containing protein n=1 Tax=Nocardioides sp. Root190 TaxID=1736488 RepID=UPI001F2A2634|nr:OB-fold domain-containing protein [Nocardioides sp. Root190]
MTSGPMGLLGYGAYVPAYRLGSESGVRGTRVVASFDEDATTMAVEAARGLTGHAPGSLWWASTSPPYLDKTNAAAVHAALRLPSTVPAADLIGSARSTFAGMRAAVASGGLVVAADVRVGKPGSADEKAGGDGAAALLFGDGDAIAEVLGMASETLEVLDRWRDPQRTTGEQWEERFGFEQYADLVRGVAARLLDEAGLTEADHVVVTSGNSGITKRAGALVKGALSSSSSPIGFSGAVDPLLGLAAVLDVAGPGETVLVLSAVDGCDGLLLRTTDLLASRRAARSVADQLAGGRPIPHLTYLSWRGLVERELPRRPEPDRPAGPPSARAGTWKFGFAGSRCTACGFVHVPPLRVCRSCSAVDAMETVSLADQTGTVATFTIDRLAFSPSPPVIDVVVDFDGGGRTTLEIADADPERVDVGAEVSLVFRRLFTAGNVHNYFWKAKVL